MRVTTLSGGRSQAVEPGVCTIDITAFGGFCRDCRATTPVRHGPVLRRWIASHVAAHKAATV